MADSAEKRAADSKSLVDKEALKADTEDNLVELGEEHKSTVKEFMATGDSLTLRVGRREAEEGQQVEAWGRAEHEVQEEAGNCRLQGRRSFHQ